MKSSMENMFLSLIALCRQTHPRSEIRTKCSPVAITLRLSSRNVLTGVYNYYVEVCVYVANITTSPIVFLSRV